MHKIEAQKKKMAFFIKMAELKERAGEHTAASHFLDQAVAIEESLG